MAALAVAPLLAAPGPPTGQCGGAAVTAAEQFLVALDARDYKRAYGLLDRTMRGSMSYPAFAAKFDARRRALGGSSTAYALRDYKSLATQTSRKRLYARGGSSCRVGFETHFPKVVVEEVVTVTAAKGPPLVSGFRDAPRR